MKRNSISQVLIALIAAIASFAILALLLRWNFFVSAILGIGVYFGLSLILTPKVVLPTPERMAEESVKEILDEAERDLQAIRTAAAKIHTVDIQKNAERLAHTGAEICAYLREKPEKISGAHRFLTYYLDTVGKLLEQYVKEQEADLQTEDAVRFRQQIQALLPKLTVGFDEQLTQLMEGDRMNLQADITVMEGLLHTEDFK